MYLLIKLLHIAAVVLFLGNITTGLFWHRHAQKSADPILLAHVMHGIIRSDRWFTNPMVFLIIATGISCAVMAGFPILSTAWIVGSIALFAVSGICFGVKLAPLQKRMHQLASNRAQFDQAQYDRMASEWERWGMVALLTPFLSMALMVLKPSW